MFETNTYVVLDVPEPLLVPSWPSEVRHRDEFRSSESADLPAVKIHGAFVLDTLSVYAMPPPMPLHSVRLGTALGCIGRV